METIHIQTASKEYDVYIGNGASNEIIPFLKNHLSGFTRILIITDQTVANLHLEKLLYHLADLQPVVFIAPSGEAAKTFAVYYDALTAALENRLDRKSVILSFGGGAVGDLGGFVAASFMRGIPFIQIPTTILAHDSAVGGKVAINHPAGKNMIGAFHQPEAVFYDLDFLSTLSDQEVRSGFAEVIKHALIDDPHFYAWLVANISDLKTMKLEQLAASLVKGIQIKGRFVSQDERETGVRSFLNFGHTLGHAVESEMGYGKFTHGESVMIGMVFALKLSQKILGLPFDLQGFIDWVKALGYLTSIPEHLSNEKLLIKMKQDKKSIAESIRFILLDQVGKPVMKELSTDLLAIELNEFR
jgi:3-dehydroquinate synthase